MIPSLPFAGSQPPASPCILVIFGASGDLTKRLLMPAFYNLVCDGLLPEHFAVVGMAMDEFTTESFREKMSADIRQFCTRKDFDAQSWDWLCSRLNYMPGKFNDNAAFARLSELVAKLDQQYQACGNVLFYMATPPSVFGLISDNLEACGFKTSSAGWKRIIVEKPFGTDLPSAIALNREILKYWTEDQIFPHRPLPRQRDRAEPRSRSASRTACSSRCGTGTSSTTSSSASRRPWVWRGAAGTTTGPACCAT